MFVEKMVSQSPGDAGKRLTSAPAEKVVLGFVRRPW